MRELIATLLAVMNTICFNLSVFQKTKKKIVFLHMCCSICDVIMYIVLGARTGIANGIANLCKNFAYAKMDSISWTLIFSGLRIVLLILGYEGPVTFAFILLEIIGMFVLVYGSTQQFRVIVLLKQILWVIYDWMFATVLIACLTSIGLVSCVAAIIKNEDKFKDDKKMICFNY